jgi:hypothetical protein
MSVSQPCYFCDESYHNSFVSNYDDVLICYHCQEYRLPINYDNRENDECCVCLEEKYLIKLPTCSHKMCFECCKTIYFGSTSNERPIHYNEMIIECPIWPYDFDDNDDERIKYEEYCNYDNEYFDIQTKNYDELIIIRNNLIPERPEWMNSTEFITYENHCFRYHTEYMKLEKEWEQYNETKTKGNGICPLCRETPL